MLGDAAAVDYSEEGDIGSSFQFKQPKKPCPDQEINQQVVSESDATQVDQQQKQSSNTDSMDQKTSHETEGLNRSSEQSEDSIPLGLQSPQSSLSSSGAQNDDGEHPSQTDSSASPSSPTVDGVQGFQLVQATGLTDTSTPAPKGSDIPSFATASPGASILPPQPPVPNTFPKREPPPPPPVSPKNETASPLSDNSKSKQFNARVDYMISEFFSRQVNRLATGTPDELDRNYRVFQQRIKERLGAQWAHVTSQPEVDDAIKQVQGMWDYFLKLEKMVDRQRECLQRLSDVETELSLYYQQQSYQESDDKIRSSMTHLSSSYQSVCKERSDMIRSYEHYVEFLRTFREKAIGDSLDTMKKQQQARLELDAYGSKLGQMEEKKLKSFARSPAVYGSGNEANGPFEKELEQTRLRFQEAKTRYQTLSTQMIDKAGLLEMKRGVDFAAHLQKVVESHNKFLNGKFVTCLPDEDRLDETK